MVKTEAYLGYKHFQKNNSKTFQKLWNDQYYSDVTLVTSDDKHVRAHKIVLSSYSAFFKHVFERYQHQNPLIYLKDIKYKYLDLILEFIYTGQCDVEESEYVWFLLVGKGLGVNRILEEIVNYDANITIKDVFNEVESIEEVKTRAEQREVTSKDALKEIGRRVMIDVSNQGNVRFVCNQCEAIYTDKSVLYSHIKSVHEDLDYYCNQCDLIVLIVI